MVPNSCPVATYPSPILFESGTKSGGQRVFQSQSWNWFLSRDLLRPKYNALTTEYLNTSMIWYSNLNYIKLYWNINPNNDPINYRMYPPPLPTVLHVAQSRVFVLVIHYSRATQETLEYQQQTWYNNLNKYKLCMVCLIQGWRHRGAYHLQQQQQQQQRKKEEEEEKQARRLRCHAISPLPLSKYPWRRPWFDI